MKAAELVEQIELNYSKHGIERVAQACIDSPEMLDLLIKLVNQANGRPAQLASWVLSKVTDLNADVVSAYFETLVKLINHSTSSSVKRNVIRTFIHIDLPEEYHGLLIDSCFKTLKNHEYSIAERSFSMHVLGKYVKIYPELSNELIPIIEVGMPLESAAFKSVGRKLLKEMKRKIYT